MANSFVKAKNIDRAALALLEREVVLPNLVWNYPASNFKYGENDTVNLTLEAATTSREYAWRNDRSSDIVIDDLTETSVAVTLSKDIYHAAALTDEQRNLDILDFSKQVLMPQVKAVARGLEDFIATTMNGATYDNELNLADSANGMWGTLIEARRLLNVANVPRDGRVLLVGSDVEAELLTDERFIRADSTGDPTALTALQNATITRLAGFTIVGSNAIDPEVAYAYHPTAFCFAHLAPLVPGGVIEGATLQQDGLSVRWIHDYDTPKLRERTVVSVFAGCTSVEDDGSSNVRAVRINFQGAS
jgi:hypothetical protein